MSKRDCRDYCRHSQHCYSNGEPGLDPDDCPVAWKIEDTKEFAECEGCNQKLPKDDMIETEFGYLCPDCFRDRMEIEDKEIYE
jgi:hypothetical protein